MKSKPSTITSKQPRLRVELKDVSRKEFSLAVTAWLSKRIKEAKPLKSASFRG